MTTWAAESTIYGLISKQRSWCFRGKAIVRQRDGFTLIELLVVISIIALLMSIMVPVLGRVKDQARAVLCCANLRQWSVVWKMVLDDNHDKFISGDEVFGLMGRSRGSMDFPLVNNAPYQTGIFDHDHSWPAVLWPYYGESKLLCCPTARKAPHRVGRYDNDPGMFSTWGLWTDYQRDFIFGSYGINCWVFDRPPRTLYGGVWPLWRRASQKTPERIPIMMDCFWCEGWPFDYHGPQLSRYELLAHAPGHTMVHFCMNRHHGKTNGLFFDLSARKIGLKGLWRLKWHRKFDTSGRWTDDWSPPPVWPEWMEKYDDDIN